MALATARAREVSFLNRQVEALQGLLPVVGVWGGAVWTLAQGMKVSISGVAMRDVWCWELACERGSLGERVCL